jgi:hypothetical protein
MHKVKLDFLSLTFNFQNYTKLSWILQIYYLHSKLIDLALFRYTCIYTLKSD